MQTSDIVGWTMLAVGIIGIAIMLFGCVGPRYTSETYWPGQPGLIVVEWPDDETEQNEIQVYNVDGRLQIVGPYRPETVY